MAKFIRTPSGDIINVNSVVSVVCGASHQPRDANEARDRTVKAIENSFSIVQI